MPALHLCMQPRTPVLLTEAVNVHLGVITVTSSKHSDTIASRFELSYAYEPVRKKKNHDAMLSGARSQEIWHVAYPL